MNVQMDVQINGTATCHVFIENDVAYCVESELLLDTVGKVEASLEQLGYQTEGSWERCGDGFLALPLD